MNPLFIQPLLEAADKVLDHFIPDPAEKAKAALELQQALTPVMIAQIELNKVEVQSGSILGKWRGAFGWALAGSFMYQFIVHPFMIAVILIFDEEFPVNKLPVLDWKQFGSALMGMLGLGV